MEPDLIDRYLRELGRSLPRTRNLGDVLAEVEDHLRESVARLTTQGVEATTAQRVTLDRFGDLTVVARAYATNAGGLAMTTTFTRAAGTIAYLAAALWLFTGVTGALITQADALDQTWSNPAVNVLVVLAMIATTTVVAGMLVRSGGVGDVPAFAALALMILATLLMAVAPWAWVVTAVPLAGAAIIAVRRLTSVGLGRAWSDWALILAWPAGAAVAFLGDALRLGTLDIYGGYPWAFLAGFSVAVVTFAAALVGVGARLHGETSHSVPVDGQGAGMRLAS